MIAECVNATISAHGLLDAGQRVCVGFSGGADSCALLIVLKELGYDCFALHIHHGIRGAEADRDAEFAKNLCRANNIDYYTEYVDVPAIAADKRLSLETAARLERIRIFNAYAEKYSCPVALAHNKCDQAETVLMHLFRGSGLNGLCGIKYKSGNIIRPLLDIDRNQIEAFCKRRNIEFVTDSTNLADEYARNKIRHNVLPAAAEAYPNVLDSVSSCARRLSLYADWLKAEASKLFDENAVLNGDNVTLNISGLHPVMQYELIKNAITAINGNAVDIDAVHINAVIALASLQSGRETDLPHGIHVVNVYGRLEFSHKKDSPAMCSHLVKNTKLPWLNGWVYAENVEKRISRGECLDEGKLPADCVIRTRQSGDRIHILNAPGSCTLKEYFIDKKIPVSVRDSVPLLASGSTVLAVIGYTVADSVKITDSTKKIINIYIGETL